MRPVSINRRVSFFLKIAIKVKPPMQVVGTPKSDSTPSRTSASQQTSHQWIWTLVELAQAAGQFR
jgi:hypothetical protein